MISSKKMQLQKAKIGKNTNRASPVACGRGWAGAGAERPNTAKKKEEKEKLNE